ncbi:MAG: MATE family efflux transporter [Rhodocyclaceae bacterium]|nr:MATE family efflux transporter [Rhodocyclaceae bacterium]
MSPAAAVAGRTRAMLEGPLAPTLFRMATPNVLGLAATTVVIGYDGYIVGRLGPEPLAGIALVLPLAMLMTQMSAGGMGGAATAVVARALGAGRRDEAADLARHALAVAVALGLAFGMLMPAAGAGIYVVMGGRAPALDAALSYSDVLFGGAVVVWLANILAAVVRGGGNMVLPSVMLAGSACLHLALCPLLVFGWGPVPALGIAGAAASTLTTSAITAAVLLAHLLSGRNAVPLRPEAFRLRTAPLRAILRIGVPASFSPVISNLSIAVATALVGTYGTAALAGYGLAARLEYVMVPIAFGFGTALTTLVATNMGAGQQARALRAAWAGGFTVAGITGAIGVAAALWPGIWMNRFTETPEVVAFGSHYLRIVGGCYGFFGLGLALFFAFQGAGRMFWPLAGSLARLGIVAGGGWLAVFGFGGGPAAFFAVVAASFAAYALTIAGALRLGAWARS